MAWQQNVPQSFTPPQYYPMVIVNSPGQQNVAMTTPYPQNVAGRSPVYSQPKPQTPSRPKAVQQKPVVTPSQPVDYRLLLLGLTDQYISAARRVASLIAYKQNGATHAQYTELITAGMRSLETYLHNPQIPKGSQAPREEAFLRLRFASLLFEETVNYDDIEASLNRSLMLCDRHRFLDLKYSMNHLLVRVLSKSNVRAAIKHLDKTLSECEALQHVPWIYAFQLLRCSLLQQTQNARDVNAALSSLRHIAEIADQRKDTEVAIYAALMQSKIHLTLRKEDSISEAQRALATARGELSKFDPKELPQLHVFASFLDVACNLDPYTQQAVPKVHEMQVLMERTLSGVKWRRDRNFVLRIHQTGFESVLSETGGIFARSDINERLGLTVSWRGRQEIHTLAMLLSALAFWQSNGRSHKSEEFLVNALKATEDNYAFEDAPSDVPLTVACEMAESRRKLRVTILLQLGLAHLGTSQWQKARPLMVSLHKELETLPKAPDLTRMWIKYIEGAIHQLSGDFPAAIASYQPLVTALDTIRAPTLNAPKILALLAAVSTLLIIRPASHPQHHMVSSLMEKIRRFYPGPHASSTSESALAAQRDDLTSALALVTTLCSERNDTKESAIKGPSSNIIDTKQTHHVALKAAQRAGNTFLLTLCLSHMHDFFFTGIIDSQGTKVAQGAATQARNTGNQMWIGVTENRLRQLQVQRQGVSEIKQEPQ